MQRYVLGRVTVFHPEVLIPDVTEQPHLNRARSLQSDRLSSPTETGRQVKALRGRLLRGALYATFLAEPRLIHIPDEHAGKAKWKLEFRGEWPDADGRLPASLVTAVVRQISQLSQEIVGVWINPTGDAARYANPEWVNLVVAAFRGQRPTPFADLRFDRDSTDVYISWD